MTTTNQNNSCAKCRENIELVETGDSEALTYSPDPVYAESDLVILVDVAKAYALDESRGLMPTFAGDPNDLARLVSRNEINEQHIYHVDSGEPGLVITFSFLTGKLSAVKC